jgi:prepilin-type N-terminal cleavage/methylation domain-containing protein
MKLRLNYKKLGFSLVEIVIVLTILGVLMSLAFRGVSSLTEAARKTKAISHLKTIADAYRQYTEDTGHPIRWKDLDKVATGGSGYDVSLIAAVLASEGYLSAVEAWIWDFDYSVRKYVSGKAIPEKICNIQKDATGKIISGKVNPNFRGKNGLPFSVCAVAAGDSCTADDFLLHAGEIPIAYSRGLREGATAPGTWASSNLDFDRGGVFEDRGGFIAFLDGHVQWFDHLGEGDRCVLQKYGADAMTNKISEALPKGAYTGVGADSLWLSWKGSSDDCAYF